MNHLEDRFDLEEISMYYFQQNLHHEWEIVRWTNILVETQCLHLFENV